MADHTIGLIARGRADDADARHPGRPPKTSAAAVLSLLLGIALTAVLVRFPSDPRHLNDVQRDLQELRNVLF